MLALLKAEIRGSKLKFILFANNQIFYCPATYQSRKSLLIDAQPIFTFKLNNLRNIAKTESSLTKISLAAFSDIFDLRTFNQFEKINVTQIYCLRMNIYPNINIYIRRYINDMYTSA